VIIYLCLSSKIKANKKTSDFALKLNEAKAILLIFLTEIKKFNNNFKIYNFTFIQLNNLYFFNLLYNVGLEIPKILIA